MNKKKNVIVMAMETAAVILLIFLDQAAKFAAIKNLKGRPSIPLIRNVFELQYLENKGAAFGVLQNQKWFFLICVAVVLAGVAWCLWHLPPKRHYFPLRMIGIFVAAGAAGNIIDRIFHGYVIDFLYFSCINFPVFNVADIYITVSMFLLFLLIVTVYRDDDFSFLLPGRKEKGSVS